MKIFYFIIFIVSISFSQNEIKYSDMIGEWEIKIKVKQLLKEEIKELDMFEKMAAELASGFAEDILNSADMYIEFKRNDIAVLTFDFLDYQEEEEIKSLYYDESDFLHKNICQSIQSRTPPSYLLRSRMDSFFFLSPPSPDLLGADMIFLDLLSEIIALIWCSQPDTARIVFFPF